ncbi:hypothetical protein HNQ07_003296 [Deinococcus metalli]|uniref:Uncharacterized protein n=1 Tax=Deinococcus metalli TaxID=1141878 RepID=A0A7W8NQE0_9DEIO|nr:hypothetical protein [Deinococcus metalli]MBB5377796.1 hypothetical protein [Deinococcus metalli]GHF55871.1 hypothetical protein GCM10017781_35370 [Deinococcus metalli]
MSEPTLQTPTLTEHPGTSDAVRAQILATEHWSLLATRSLTWTETFSRAGMFLTVVSGAVVALALVGNATAFGPAFRGFALLLLPVVLLIGLLTYARLSDANLEEIGLLIGMNRLRHAYLEIAPELTPYFVTGLHDDEAGIAQTYGTVFHRYTGYSVIQALSGTPELVGLITAVTAGVLGELVTGSVGGSERASVVTGIICGVALAAALMLRTLRRYARARRAYQPRFPS